MRKSPRGTHTFRRLEFKLILVIFILSQRQYLADARAQQQQQDSGTSFQLSQQNGFQLHQSSMSGEISADANGRQLSPSAPANVTLGPTTQVAAAQPKLDCPNGLLTFELLTGYIYKPSSGAEVLSSMPSTLQLTDCLDYCLHNSSCLAINFEMGLCVLLAQSARQRPHNLFTSQFPVFTIYAEKKCLLSDAGGRSSAAASGQQQGEKRKKCQRAWAFERVSGYEMKTKPRRRLRALASKEACMEACLVEREFECRSANWHRLTGDCHLSDQDRHSVSQSEAGDQRLKASLGQFYGPSNGTSEAVRQAAASELLERARLKQRSRSRAPAGQAASTGGSASSNSGLGLGQWWRQRGAELAAAPEDHLQPYYGAAGGDSEGSESASGALVDYLENNCVHEPNKLCHFHKLQNRVLKTVDAIYQDVANLEECKQKCLAAPYRCYSFDYGDTAERVCRTSHLDQAALVSVRDPYLEVVGAITYELASCFNVSIQCRAKEMVALVSASKVFRGKIYAKSRPSTCVKDVREALTFELAMGYQDQEGCDVRAASNEQRGLFSNDIVIQHHDRIVTTQDVGLSVYCHYDLGNRSVTTNQVDLAIERLPDLVDSKQAEGGAQQAANGSSLSALTITGLATTVVRPPNVTMRITNMNGQPVSSATVGDRLALMFEITEKSSPFGIFVREIVAIDGKQLMSAMTANSSSRPTIYHYANNNYSSGALNESAIESFVQQQQESTNSIQFIDSSGCPTDANLMGPPVRMDPHGHRLLAPFDAFKFPTSDMVFFRAVVSSCVTECKPAICPSAALSGGELASNYVPSDSSSTLGLDNYWSPESEHEGEPSSVQFEGRTTLLSTALPTSTAASAAAPTLAPAASSRPLPLPQTTGAGATSSPSVATTEADDRRQGTGAPTEELTRERSSPLSTERSGDSLTTVAGFARSTTRLPDLDNGALVGGANVTLSNNHLLGHQLPPRPSSLVQVPLSGSASSDNNNGSLSSPNTLLTDQQRQTISDLLIGSDSSLRAIFASNLASNHLSSPNQDEDEAGQQIGANKTAEALDRLLAKLATNLTLSERAAGGATMLTIDELPANYAESHQQQQQRLATGSGPQTSVEATSGAKGTSNKRNKERDRQQALADSYLGAYQSMGRKRRRKRQTEEDNDLTKSSYVLMVQPQEPSSWPNNNLSTPHKLGDNLLLFTHGTVEMYHGNRAEEEQRLQLHRTRRQVVLEPPSKAGLEEQASEELVVQSIKIVDRLRFEDDQQQPAKQTKLDHVVVPRPADFKSGPGRNPSSLFRKRDSLMRSKYAAAANNQQDGQETLAAATEVLASSNSPLSAMSIFLVAMCFVFVQISMVLLCLVDWSPRSKEQTDGHPPVRPSPSLDGSTITRAQQRIVRSPVCSTLGSSLSSTSTRMDFGNFNPMQQYYPVVDTNCFRQQPISDRSLRHQHEPQQSPSPPTAGRREQRLLSSTSTRLFNHYNQFPS